MASGPSRTAATTGPLVRCPHQIFEEELPHVLGVVFPRQRLLDLHELESHKPEAAALEPRQQIHPNSSLQGIGFQQDQRAFHLCSPPIAVGESSSDATRQSWLALEPLGNRVAQAVDVRIQGRNDDRLPVAQAHRQSLLRLGQKPQLFDFA